MILTSQVKRLVRKQAKNFYGLCGATVILTSQVKRLAGKQAKSFHGLCGKAAKRHG